MVKSSINGRNSPGSISNDRKKFLQLGGIVNKIRIIQGWNMIAPDDAKPIIAVWAEQLDRFNISPELYSTLLDRAVNHRVSMMREGVTPTPLTVELFITTYQQYVSEARQKYSEIIRPIRHEFVELENAKEYLKPFVPCEPATVEGSSPNPKINDFLNSMRHRFPKLSPDEQREEYHFRQKNYLQRINKAGDFADLADYVEKTEARHQAIKKQANDFWAQTLISEPAPATKY